MKTNKFLSYAIPIIAIVFVAALGGVFSGLGNDWYQILNLPTQWVPDFLFSVVWTTIYIAFGVYLVWAVYKNTLTKNIVVLAIINGILNILWTFVFFANSLILLGLIVILFNLFFAYLLVYHIFKQNKIWGYILSLYAVWITIATMLNIAIWILN